MKRGTQKEVLVGPTKILLLHPLQKMKANKMKKSSKGTKRKQRTSINYKKLTRKDYVYCEDCEEYIDFWKYDSIEDTGHSECKWRLATEKELKECIDECKKNDCFKEDYYGE
jgi:hypothetical protein